MGKKKSANISTTVKRKAITDERAETKSASTIDEYIAEFAPKVQEILKEIVATIRAEAAGAEEIISYRMPAFRMHGMLVYFAAFKNHIGLYPPVSGDTAIEKAIRPYAGEKGNLRFPLDQPIPLNLIRRIVKLRVKQDRNKAAAKKQKRN